MSIRPRNGQILVLVDEQDTKTAGGILLVPAYGEDKNTGLVVAVGTGEDQVKVGERVLFPKYTGTIYMQDDKKHLFMDVSEVLAVEEA